MMSGRLFPVAICSALSSSSSSSSSFKPNAGRGTLHIQSMKEQVQVSMPRKRCPPTALRIHTPQHHINPLVLDDSSSHSTLSSPTASDLPATPLHPLQKPRSLRNMKKLSINLPSAESSTHSLLSPLSPPPSVIDSTPIPASRSRRPSILSLPSNTVFHRRDEDGSPTIPYLDGPIQVLPGVWLGSEENARDWPGLIQHRIKAILNVAKEVTSPFDQPLRQSASTPNLASSTRDPSSTYYPPHLPSGRPGMYYLKLHWSHGEKHLVRDGFPVAMAFVDAALARNEGVLIHCQCGISRSATLVIAIVMRAAATRSPLVPPQVWELKGMQAAYSFVKEKSRHVGPNMSLIYQLVDYEKTLQGGNTSPARSDKSSSISEEEREWSHRHDGFFREGYEDPDSEAQQEAKKLDLEMEARIARQPSTSSISLGPGTGPVRRNREARKRTGSLASIRTTGSVLSERLVEADEEAELLGVGGGFDDTTEPRRSPSLSSESPGSSSESDAQSPLTSNTSPARPPLVRRHLTSVPSAPPTKLTFDITRLSVSRPSLKTISGKPKRRTPPIGMLPPVPPSPITPVAGPDNGPSDRSLPPQTSRKRMPSALKLRSPPGQITFPSYSASSRPPASVTPSQTLFVFPPSPTIATAMRTPATMTVTSNVYTNAFPFPSQATPRVATSSSKGRTKSFIGVGASMAPTTAYSRVDARGWVGREKGSAAVVSTVTRS